MAFGRKKRKDGQEEEEQQAGAPSEDINQGAAGNEPATLAPAGDEFAEATVPAGDPAAATGIDAEGGGPDADPFGVNGAGDPSAQEGGTPQAAPPPPAATPDEPPDTQTFSPPAPPPPSPVEAAGEPLDAEALGSAAASPDPVVEPASAVHDDPGLGAYDQQGGTPGAATVVETHPEVLVAGAFAAGIVVARVLAALGDDR